MKIGLVSAHMVDNDINKQISEMEHYLKNSQDCDWLCFGEAFLHGFYGLAWSYDQDKEKAIPVDGEVMSRIKTLAKKYRKTISFGFIERADNGDLYSSNIVINDRGQQVDLFRRVSEGWKQIAYKKYKEGDFFHIFTYKGSRFATAICGDLWWDNHLSNMINLDTDYVLWPLYIDYSPEDWKDGAREEYAEQVKSIKCPVLMINSYVDTPNEAKGGCCIFYRGQVLKELPIGKQGVLVVDI